MTPEGIKQVWNMDGWIGAMLFLERYYPAISFFMAVCTEWKQKIEQENTQKSDFTEVQK